MISQSRTSILKAKRQSTKNMIVFLDRDGVINEFPGNGKYVTQVKDFQFIPRSLDAIRMLTEAGCILFVISNQAGVGKGVFSQKKLDLITDKMLRGIEKHGGKIRKVYYSVNRSDSGCPLRKPNIGSVRLALKSINKDLRACRNAYFVGDTETDIKAGKNAGCKTIFVLSGREDCLYMRRWDDVEPDYIVKDLYDAARLITKSGRANVIEPDSKLAKVITNKRRRKQSGLNLLRRTSDKPMV